MEQQQSQTQVTSQEADCSQVQVEQSQLQMRACGCGKSAGEGGEVDSDVEESEPAPGNSSEEGQDADTAAATARCLVDVDERQEVIKKGCKTSVRSTAVGAEISEFSVPRQVCSTSSELRLLPGAGQDKIEACSDRQCQSLDLDCGRVIVEECEVEVEVECSGEPEPECHKTSGRHSCSSSSCEEGETSQSSTGSKNKSQTFINFFKNMARSLGKSVKPGCFVPERETLSLQSESTADTKTKVK